MKKTALIVAIVGLAVFISLLVGKIISDSVFVAILILLAAVCLILLGFDRVEQFTLGIKECRVLLKQAKEIKSELTEMYGGIQNLKRYPLTLDKSKMDELGLGAGHLGTADATMRYTAGVVKRERERLARIFATSKTPEQIAQAILDGTFDELVFKWNGPETSLETPPKSVAQRKAEKQS